VFRTRKLQRCFNAQQLLAKEYGQRCAQKIMRRMAVLAAAPNLSKVPTKKPDRCHELGGRRKGQFAVDLEQPHRLIFRPYPYENPGSRAIRRETVTAIEIRGVEDYH